MFIKYLILTKAKLKTKNVRAMSTGHLFWGSIILGEYCPVQLPGGNCPKWELYEGNCSGVIVLGQLSGRQLPQVGIVRGEIVRGAIVLVGNGPGGGCPGGNCRVPVGHCCLCLLSISSSTLLFVFQVQFSLSVNKSLE